MLFFDPKPVEALLPKDQQTILLKSYNKKCLFTTRHLGIRFVKKGTVIFLVVT
jgi:hypothetical protein